MEYIQPTTSSVKDILKKNPLSFRHLVFLLLYYIIAFRLPQPPLPGSRLGHWFRKILVMQIFQECGKGVRIAANVNFDAGIFLFIGNIRWVQILSIQLHHYRP